MTTTTDFEETTESVPVPVSMNINGAVKFTGFTEQRIRNLIKEGAIEVGYMGSKKKYYYVIYTHSLREVALNLPRDPSELPD